MNTIDELMDKDPLSLSDQDLDEIISYERKQRGIFEASDGKGRGRPKKYEGEKKDLDINSLLAGLKASGLNTVVIDEPPRPKIGRRF